MLGPRIKVYFENKHSSCKTWKSKRKKQECGREGLITKGQHERIWRMVEVICILNVAVVTRLYAFVQTPSMC